MLSAALPSLCTFRADLVIVKVFDILMINGKSLLDRSTSSRKVNLKNSVNEIKGRIEYATTWKGKTAKDVRKRMEEVMDARCVDI